MTEAERTNQKNNREPKNAPKPKLYGKWCENSVLVCENANTAPLFAHLIRVSGYMNMNMNMQTKNEFVRSFFRLCMRRKNVQSVPTTKM